MGNRGTGYADNSYRPTTRSTYRTGQAIDSSSNFGLADSYADIPCHSVEPSDIGRRSELQCGTLISVGDTVEITNDHIIKISRMWRDTSGVIMLFGELFIPHDERLPPVAKSDAVFLSYYTTNGVDEQYLEHNLVELRKVKQLRRLLMITPDQHVPGTVQQQMQNASSDLPTLFCGWKHITLGAANGESIEESIRPLTASEVGLAPNNCDRSQYESMPAYSSFSGATRSNLALSRRYTFGDLYCGSGGMSRGAELAGLCVSWGLDSDPRATTAFGMNFPTAKILQISDTDLCDHYLRAQPPVITDILHVSPPFKPFSNNHTIAGPNDDENRACLFRIRRTLEVIKPRVVTFESVPGLMLRHTSWFNLVLRSFTSSGYSVRWKLVQCAEHGVPQTRRRIFIIAAR